MTPTRLTRPALAHHARRSLACESGLVGSPFSETRHENVLNIRQGRVVHH